MEADIRTYSNDQDLVRMRRLQIVRAATKLLVKKGYERTNVRELAKTCKMSVGSLYHYVGSKEDVLYLIFQHALSQQAESIESFASKFADVSPATALPEYIKMYYQKMDEIRTLVVFMYQETKNVDPSVRKRLTESENRITAAFEDVLARGIEVGEFKPHDARLVAQSIVMLGQMWPLRRWTLKGQYSLEEYIKAQTELIVKGIQLAIGKPESS